MACGAIRSWTLPSLVASFLDLALASLVLTAAALAFLASRFLALFGLALPCSCRPGREPSGCLPSLLAEYTARKVSGVHLALRESHRYDSACCRCRCRCCDAKLGGFKEEDFGNVDRVVSEMGGGGVGGEDEESCGSVSKPCASNFSLPAAAQTEGAKSRDVAQGKGIPGAETSPMVPQRRRRRRNILIVRGKSPHSSLTPPPTLQFGGGKGAAAGTPFSCEMQQRASEVIPSPHFPTDGDRLSGNQIGLGGDVASDKSLERSASCGIKQVWGSKEYGTGIMRDLKQALEEEQSARAALYLELEKERNAAATAADEALAMILRLQEEKAAIEMEARQFQRMIEEKSAYDDEEMEILKEIILRREMEKHFLEKEVETYRTMMLSGGDVQQPPNSYPLEVAQPFGRNLSSLFDSTVNAELLLKENYKIIEKGKLKDKMQGVDDCRHFEAKEQISLSSFHNEPPSQCTAEDDLKKGHNAGEVHQNMLYHGDECNVQDKSMVTIEILPSSSQKEASGYGQGVSITDDLDKQNESGIHELTSCPNEDGTQTNIFMSHNKNTIKTSIESPQLEIDPRVIDLHVIDDKVDMGDHENDELVIGCNSGLFGKHNKKNEPSRTKSSDFLTPNSAASCGPTEPIIHRSNSDMTKARHSMDGAYWRPQLLGLRRSSMSAVENERFKLENEVELLRNRLKLVHQGREKLNVSVEKRENDLHHVQLLEEIAFQLQELKKTAEPGSNLRRSSLPPYSSRVLRKRRHSVSGALHEST